MKILQVVDLFSRLHGGSAEVPYQLCRQLCKNGHEVTVYTSDYKLKQESRSPIRGVKIRALRTWLGLANFYITPGIIVSATKEIKHFDLIHLHNYRTFQNIIVHHYAKKYGIPYVLQAHGSLTTFFQKGRLKKIFDMIWGNTILRDASRVIAVTEIEAEQYRSMGVNQDRIEIVPNGVDLAEFSRLPERGQFRTRYGFSADQRIVLYLGRIHKTKGLDIMAKAFADLIKLLDNVKLVVTGPDGGYLRAFMELVKELGIEESTLLTGPLYGMEKLAAYIDADVFVLPSYYETFPITILEACACGLPVIITDRCGIVDIVDGHVGIVIPCEKDRLRDAILKLLGGEKARLFFGQEGKRLVQVKFNWVYIAKQMDGIYREVVS